MFSYNNIALAGCNDCNNDYHFCGAGNNDCCSCGGGESPPPPPATCSYQFSVPDPTILDVGETKTLSAIYGVSDGAWLTWNFSLRPDPDPAALSSSGFLASVSGKFLGTARVYFNGIVSGEGGSGTCTDSVGVKILPPRPWWQAGNANILSGGNITSNISWGCTVDPLCTPNLILDGPGGYPGVAIYNGAPPSLYQPSALVSSTGWGTNTPYTGQTYDFNFFDKTKPAGLPDQTLNNPNSTPGTTFSFDAEAQQVGDYHWYTATGNTTITSDISIAGNRKVILLIRGGDLTLDGNVQIQNKTNSLFMAVVDGRIIVSSLDTGPTLIEGLYLAEDNFVTSSKDNPAGICQLIDFETYPDGSPVNPGAAITNQYSGIGATFSSNGGPVTATNGVSADPETPTEPNYVVGTPDYLQPMQIILNEPSENVSVQLIGIGNSSVTVSAYDSSGNLLESQAINNPGLGNGVGQIDYIKFNSNNVSRINMDFSAVDPLDGVGLDDLAFCSTSGADLPLAINGSVITQGQLQLRRDLGFDNQNTPSEFINFSPELLLNFPQGFAPKRLIWKEINP
jgi:hypothetical protein